MICTIRKTSTSRERKNKQPTERSSHFNTMVFCWIHPRREMQIHLHFVYNSPAVSWITPTRVRQTYKWNGFGFKQLGGNPRSYLTENNSERENVHLLIVALAWNYNEIGKGDKWNAPPGWGQWVLLNLSLQTGFYDVVTRLLVKRVLLCWMSFCCFEILPFVLHE